MAYSLATREEIARTPGLFADTATGALLRHATHLLNPEVSATEDDETLALAIVQDADRYTRSLLRLILHAPAQHALEDVTALTDDQVLTLVQTAWPVLLRVEWG